MPIAVRIAERLARTGMQSAPAYSVRVAFACARGKASSLRTEELLRACVRTLSGSRDLAGPPLAAVKPEKVNFCNDGKVNLGGVGGQKGRNIYTGAQSPACMVAAAGF